jgi:hypothetical protein
VRSVAWDRSFFIADAKLNALSRCASRGLKDYGHSVVEVPTNSLTPVMTIAHDLGLQWQ